MPIKIFVSYSHQNSDWVDANGKYELIPWLKKQLKRENVEFWTDHALRNHIGEEYKLNLHKNIQDADIALLLVSQDFATSDFILEYELPWIMEEHQQRTMKIIPLLIDVLGRNGRKNIPWIFELQTIPNDTKPIIEYTDNAVEWSKVRTQILDVIFDKIEIVKNGSDKKLHKPESKKPISEQERIAAELKELQEKNIRLEEELTKQKLNQYSVQPKKTEIQSRPNESTISTYNQSAFSDFTETVNGMSFEMVAVKGGTFTMGSPKNEDKRDDDEKQHQVTLSNYHIGKYEVTQALWKAVMGNNPSSFKGDNLPVETVSWNDCQLFIQKLNQLTGKKYSLPTEAQWEFAARGGTRSRSYLYAGSNNPNDVAWHDGNSERKTHPVGQKQPNELGLHDMSGNVWEWCQDWYGSYPEGQQIDPIGPSSGACRVFRWGGWVNTAQGCRLADRGYFTPATSLHGLGFRLVFSPV